MNTYKNLETLGTKIEEIERMLTADDYIVSGTSRDGNIVLTSKGTKALHALSVDVVRALLYAERAECQAELTKALAALTKAAKP
jgi:hypothetical protein